MPINETDGESAGGDSINDRPWHRQAIYVPIMSELPYSIITWFRTLFLSSNLGSETLGLVTSWVFVILILAKVVF